MEMTADSQNVNGKGNAGFQMDEIVDNTDNYQLEKDPGLSETSAQASPNDQTEQRVRSNGLVASIQETLKAKLRQHKRSIGLGVKCLLLGLYFAYFGYAMYYRFGDEGSIRLLVCTLFGFLLMVLSLTSARIKSTLLTCCAGCCRRSSRTQRFRQIFRWTLYVLVLGFIVLYTGLDMGRRNPRNLMSLAGIAVFILLLYLTSASPGSVNWHPVFWGLSIQYIFALLIIRTSWGFEAFNWLGDRVTEMLAYSNKGAEFVFGDKYLDHPFAMKVSEDVLQSGL